MKLVEHADGLMQEAEKLFQDHQSIMRGDDRTLSEDQLIRQDLLLHLSIRGLKGLLFAARGIIDTA